jgi:uncharacterized protein with HEPN domain
MSPEESGGPERNLKTLDDIHDAASFILEASTGKVLEDYRNDRLLKQAIERNFEVAGEAIGRLSREAPEAAGRIGEYERIIAFRNVLIHGYDLVDDDLVWDTIREKVPKLVSDVERLLEEYG